jgi:hypothetical protein
LRRDISKDAVISFADVDSPRGRLVETLWRDQNARWPLESTAFQPQSRQLAPVIVG